MSERFVVARGVTKVFDVGRQEVRALRGVDLDVREGEFLALVGPSGSGKTTLLNLLGALDVPDRRRADRARAARSPRCRKRERARAAAALDRVRVPGLQPRAGADGRSRTSSSCSSCRASGTSGATRAHEVLQELGLGDLADRRPSELSGGQQQRVAVARAVAARPKLVLADEPTANLDGENAEILMHLMRDLRDRHGMTFIFSTHDPRVVAHAVRVVTLVDGRVARDEVKPGEAPHEILPGIGKAPVSLGG